MAESIRWNADAEEPWTYSIRDASDLLCVSERVLRGEIDNGTIRVVRLGRRILIPASAIRDFLGDVENHSEINGVHDA